MDSGPTWPARGYFRFCIEVRHFKCILNDYLQDVQFGYTYSRPACVNNPLHQPQTGADSIPEEVYTELSEYKQKQLGPLSARSYDSEKVRRDRVLHWLMRSTIVQLGDIQGLADTELFG